ncbi:VOC family protein [Patulibacter defluvii]|uniref:VOC family protein n=1 Tax=Patulibacter defluvii TaxID=3095358 RepID=UPI002A7527E9|nr:VOC family protein [Patulibacter sp. DM4]
MPAGGAAAARIGPWRSTSSPASTCATSRPWYERLLGREPAFLAHATEAVWELAEHRYLAVAEEPEHAGHGRPTVFVGDLDGLLAGIAERGLEPSTTETYANGVRKAIFRDPDGNQIGFGGGPG